jgi:hypothetical protein
MCIEIKVEDGPIEYYGFDEFIVAIRVSSPSPAKTKHSAWSTIDYSKEVKIQIEIQES